MAPSIQTARIFEDPEPPKSKSHKRVPSVGDVLRGRRKENNVAKGEQPSHNNHASPSPLGERHINSPPQPKKIPLKGEEAHRPPMHKKTSSAASLKGFLMGRDRNSDAPPHESKAEDKPKKTRSSTNLVGLLKKRSKKDLKENTGPIETGKVALTSPTITPTPIWAQFATQPLQCADGSTRHPQGHSRTLLEEIELYTPKDYSEYRPADQRNFQEYGTPSIDFKPPQRPFLEHKSSRSSIFTENLEDEADEHKLQRPKSREQSRSRPVSPPQSPRKTPMSEQAPSSPGKTDMKSKRSSRILNTIATLNMKPRRNDCSNHSTELVDREALSPQELDSAMENMLGRYDIPQNLRDQLRNLKPEVKAGLMKGERIGSGSSTEVDYEKVRHSARAEDTEQSESNDNENKDGKRSRSRSRTRSRILSLSKKNDGSPTKEDKTGRSRSKSRPKSVDLSRPLSMKGMVSTTSLVSVTTPDCAVTPGDFIHYLREVQKPELVEVGKLHKLRILLRNESVTWTDAFVRKGGLDEIVQLLYRIMKIEWREEHEDNLLHETLLCLKGLSTTSLAKQHLELASRDLFPALLKMIFDPERKGPAEYSTRSIVVSLIYSQLSATVRADAETHQKRAQELLAYLRDPAPEDKNQPLDFVTQMHTSRPYRIWCKEVTNVTKEVFWIFLHNMNVVPVLDTINDGEADFTQMYFPSARAPHPAAPYVGGVEWEATQYLATHLDLLNALIVSLPTQRERNALRDELRQSGWERLMGGSLRTCKEKFYSGVHDGLKAWVAAARSDGWPVEDVRAGPPRESSSPRKSPIKKKAEEAPKLALDVGAPVLPNADDAWL